MHPLIVEYLARDLIAERTRPVRTPVVRHRRRTALLRFLNREPR